MESKTAEMQHLMERLERVERQNRWLVCGGLVLVLLCGSVLLMAQKPLAQDVEAQKFVLKDAEGKERAELHMTDSGPELALLSSSPSGAEAHLNLNNGAPGLVLRGVNGKAALLRVDEDGPSLALISKKQDGVWFAGLDIAEDEGPRLKLARENGGLSAAVHPEGPNLSLLDSEGFTASIGSKWLINPSTGEKRQSSAASIHLLDKKDHVIWSAP
jgi:hypothetical protein